MHIAVLGPLEVLSDDGVSMAVPGAKERLLLAVLAADAPDVVSIDRIEDALWNGNPPVTARKSLQIHLVHLRSALEPERAQGSAGHYVVRRGTGYALAVGRDEMDSLRMVDLVARGRARQAAGDPGEAARLLSTAVGLWRGKPYADWPDASFADAERRRLTELRRGAVTALLEARLALGEHAEVAAETEGLLVEDPLQEEWWRLLVLALYRGGRQGDALAAAARARAALVEQLGADPGPRLRAVEAAVLAQDPALDHPAVAPALPAGSPSSDVPPCPYKGLATYQAADAALFHGRARIVNRLVGLLVDTPLLVVSGSSGAGKSSLVRAGLLPALAGGALPQSASWRLMAVAPGRSPMDALAPLTGDARPSGPVALVCDQFEELWAPGVVPAERAAFLDAILGLLDDGIVVRCVAVVRGDHVGRLAEHAAFTERLGSALVLAPALADEELREVVREPASAAGLTVDEELLDVVVNDVRGRPGALPMLSTALVGTWERRRGDRLTLSGYLEAGGVAGALARTAEDAYAALDDDGRSVARRLLVRLADLDDGGALVRRTVPLAELEFDSEGGSARREVVETFVARRLLSLDGDRLEVAHEALLTGWPRLTRWLEDDAAGRAVRRQLAPSARAWADGGHPDDELYRGARLAAALEWASGADADPAPVERQFLDASRERADADLTEARDRARREATARRRTRRLAIGLAAVLVVALVATGLAVRSQRASDRASLVADANRLAALSTAVHAIDLSELLAAEGFRLADTPETQDGLLAGLVERRRAARAAQFSGDLFGADLGNDGRSLFIWAGHTVVRWDILSGDQPQVLIQLDAEGGPAGWGGWTAADASPTDDRTIFAGADEAGPWLRLADGDGEVEQLQNGALLGGAPVAAAFTPDGRRVNLVVTVPEEGGGAVTSWRLVQVDLSGGVPRQIGVGDSVATGEGGLGAHFDAQGTSAVVWSRDDTVGATMIDLATGSEVTVAPPARDTTMTSFRALPTGAAVVWADGVVTLVDRAGAVVQELPAQRTPVWDVTVTPGGSWAATVGERGEVVLWDVDPITGQWSQREVLAGHDGDVVQAEVDPTGAYLVTTSTDNEVVVWDVRPDGGFGTSHPGLADRWVANAPAVVEPGRLVVAPTRPLDPEISEMLYVGGGTLDVAATFLDPRTGAVVDQVEVGNTSEDAFFGASVAVSPDGRLVAVTSGLATTVLDTRTREVVGRVALPPNGNTGVDGRSLPAGLVCCAVWSRDGSRLLLGTGGYLPGTLIDDAAPAAGEIAVVDTATWDVVDRVPLEGVPEVLQFDRDRRWLAVASANSSEVVILDADTLRVRRRVALSITDSLWALSFSPDGRLLAGAGELGQVHVVDTDTWRARDAVPLRSGGPTIQLDWLADSRTVLSTSVTGDVLLFDTQRALVRTPPLPASVDGQVGYARMLPAPEDEVVLFDDDHTALTYSLDPADWLRDACAVAGRELTRAEWNRYLPGRDYRSTCTDLD